jgi:SNF2 family DNA or RNA helicase
MYRSHVEDYIRAVIQTQLNEQSARAQQPPWITVPLRPHQQTLLAAAKELEKKNSAQNITYESSMLLSSYGILGDRVGSGKSLVALSLVKEVPPSRISISTKKGLRGAASLLTITNIPPSQPFDPNWSSLSSDAFFPLLFSEPSSLFFTETAIAIVPHNVVTQWERYVHQQTSLRAYFVKKQADCDHESPTFCKDIFTSDIVVVSSSMVRKFIHSLNIYDKSIFARIIWSRLFIDEADVIPCTLRIGDISSRFIWFLTSSWLNMLFPSGLRAHTFQDFPEDIISYFGGQSVAGVGCSANGFIYNTLTETTDVRFVPLLLRNMDRWVQESLGYPPVTHETIICKAPVPISLVQEFISAAALEALHAGDIDGALQSLGMKPSSTETIIERFTKHIRGELIQHEKILAFKRNMEYSSSIIRTHVLEHAEAKIARLRAQLLNLETKLAEITNEMCPICYDTPRTPTISPCCRQVFCFPCICQCISMQNTCPMCRHRIENMSQLVVIHPTGVSPTAEEKEEKEEVKEEPVKTKDKTLLRILEQSTEQERFLVFSAREASFRGVKEILAFKGIRCELLSGSAARIERLCSQFREGTIRILCMNARHLGSGLNLEDATHIVLYHKMTRGLEEQIIGRAIRFDRQKPLSVIHLVHEQETVRSGISSSEIIVHV